MVLEKPLGLSRRFASRLTYAGYGYPKEVLRLERFSPEPLRPDQVRVKMKLAAVNPADLNTIQGNYPLKPALPAVGGGEGVGVVEELGADAQRAETKQCGERNGGERNGGGLRIGDLVITARPMAGVWATELAAPAKDFIRLRPDLPLVAAATMQVNPSTAFRMLHDFVYLEPGDSVIQNGANSAVGQAVIQLCRSMGVLSINVVRDRPEIDQLKAELSSLGADIVWTEEELRKTLDFRENRRGRPKLAFNCVGGASGTELCKSLAKFGVHVTYGGMSLKPVIAPTSSLIFQDISLRGFWMSRWVETNAAGRERFKMYDHLSAMLVEGSLRPPKHVILPMSQYQDAIDNTLKGFKKGKYLIDLTEDK